jgi:hypothetical protein
MRWGSQGDTSTNLLDQSVFDFVSVNLPPKPLKCFTRLFENILEAGQWIFNSTYISRPIKYQLKIHVQGNQSPANDRKYERNLRTH